MSEPFIGEIRAFGFNFPPRGWATCAGQLLPISQNTALFSILGTYFGGNGTTNFALPNLQGNVPLHVGSGPGLSPRTIGETGGAPQVTLNVNQMPAHITPPTATAAPAPATVRRTTCGPLMPEVPANMAPRRTSQWRATLLR